MPSATSLATKLEGLYLQSLIVIMAMYDDNPWFLCFSLIVIQVFHWQRGYHQVLGYICYHILAAGLNGYMASITNLKNPSNKWRCGAAPLTVLPLICAFLNHRHLRLPWFHGCVDLFFLALIGHDDNQTLVPWSWGQLDWQTCYSSCHGWPEREGVWVCSLTTRIYQTLKQTVKQWSVHIKKKFFPPASGGL